MEKGGPFTLYLVTQSSGGEQALSPASAVPLWAG